MLPSFLEGHAADAARGASYGTPVVASDIPPHREVLGSERPLVPPGDERALAEAIRRALERHPHELREAEALRPKVLSAYRWEATTDATEALYERLLGRR